MKKKLKYSLSDVDEKKIKKLFDLFVKSLDEMPSAIKNIDVKFDKSWKIKK